MKDYNNLLSQLVAARLNHDYVAPLTAISNSCELMQISPDTRDECVALITDTVESSINLLQFYRLAFGPHGKDDDFSIGELERLVQHMANEQSARVEFQFRSRSLARKDAKLITLAFLCVRSSFVKMTDIQISEKQDLWAFNAIGTGAIEADESVRFEAEWHETIKPSATNIHFPLLLRHIDADQRELSRKVTGESLSLEIWKR